MDPWDPGPLAPQGGPLDLQEPFFMNFGGLSGSLGAPFFYQDRVLDPCYSMFVSQWFLAAILMDFGCSWHALGPKKTCETIGGLFKIKVLPNFVKGGLWKLPGSIFQWFWNHFWEVLEVSGPSLGHPVWTLIFERISRGPRILVSWSGGGKRPLSKGQQFCQNPGLLVRRW